jgi:TRAP-type C4-dicarboxylate transport system substrate-binding protein
MIVRRTFLAAAALAAATVALPAVAQQTFKLTIASSHPTTLPWVGLMSTYFVPEVTRRVEALGKGYKIEWREAYGGQLYKMNATLSSVSEGIADIGWVFGNLEAAKMPLLQVSANAPFATDNLPAILDVMNELNDTHPALRAEWDKNNLVFLGASGVDTYHLWTKFPIQTVGDLKGRKISAPGVLGTWLRGTGATAVDGSLTTYYTDIQTGVSEGTVSIATGILPAKVYEVAPYITKVSMGALYNGGMAMNKDTWQKLPPDVQKIMKEVGREYSRRLGAEVMARYDNALKSMLDVGARQNPPVRLFELPAAERANWVKTMPNIAGDWVKANEGKRLPAKDVLTAYMDGLRKKGEKPLREWDKEQ